MSSKGGKRRAGSEARARGGNQSARKPAAAQREGRQNGRARETARPVLITGGAGFVGTNLAGRLLEAGRRVRVFDDLSRPGVEQNLEWLTETYGARVEFVRGDVRDAAAVSGAARDAEAVFHFAAQVAVTTSLVSPVEDFETNARGTLNVLEAVRLRTDPPPLVFTSTNKVYGALEDVRLEQKGGRYRPADPALAASGIGESRPLDFHSPYGCSKGAGDQYVLDYARTYRLPALVFRMSCIYGPHQFGNEDQGWVAHFLIRALEGRPVTLYGDGRQVRDILFVEDLSDAFLLAWEKADGLAGRAFNIGGGPENTTSLLELIDLIGELRGGRRPEVEFAEWRHADQRYYVSDTRGFRQATGWRPRVGVREGVGRLHRWLLEHRGLSPVPLVAGKDGARAPRGLTAEAATGRV
jgi:CDP-paratose 2-epimerase